MTFDYDLFVIGGGSGGVRAARIAASEGGARVALAEESRMGGTCVIRGCVPKKLMVFASEMPEAVSQARAYGWDATIGSFDWTAFRNCLEDELTRLEAAYRKTLKTAGVIIYDARANLIDPHTIALSTGKTITAKHILIATGGLPFVPHIPGADLAVTSDAMFHLPKLPTNAVIVGGGYIASEFACILNGLGVKVTQIYRGDEILRGFDIEARTHVVAGMERSGIQILRGRDVMRLDKADDQITVHSSLGEIFSCDLVLYATGRRPNTAGLGLEQIGVTVKSNGAVMVDEFSQTVLPSVYAVGDVTDRINLTPVAIREGHALADTLFNARPTKADHELVPSAVFTQPEFGTIGLTEEQAAARGLTDVYVSKFRPMRTAFAGMPEQYLMKLVVDTETQKVLGCHIVGPGAGEMIQLAAIAVKLGATKGDFDRTIAVHPTASEEIVTMRKVTRQIGATIKA